MKLLVFSVFDSKAETFGTPMFFNTIGMATRAFFDEANREDSMIFKHGADYTLFQIGEFDPDKGELIPLDAKSNLGTGVEFKSINQE
jgi:hypothetical protein